MVWAVYLSPSFSHSFDFVILPEPSLTTSWICLFLSAADSLEQVQGELLELEAKQLSKVK